MKKVVKPSPWMAIFFGAIACLCSALTISGIDSGEVSFFPEIFLDFILIGVFIWLLLRYLSQKKIFYDDSTFTVGEKIYTYGEITNITVDSEQVIRNVSTLRLKIYIDEEEICSFTKDDKGGKDFIAILKNNDIAFNIEA